MQKTVIFSLSLDCHKKPNSCFLQIDSFDQKIPMQFVRYYRPTKTYQFEVPIPISNTVAIPKLINYNYFVNDVQLYQTNQILVIAKRPTSNKIYVNDTKVPRDNSNLINILFCVASPQLTPKQLLYLVCESPLFVNPKDYINNCINNKNNNNINNGINNVNNNYNNSLNIHYNNMNFNDNINISLNNQNINKNVFDGNTCVVPMQFSKGLWFGSANVSVFLNHPIIYKYVVIDSSTKKEVARETGRPHFLLINSPLAYKSIHIYDAWSQTMPLFAFYPRSVKPSETSIIESSVKIEFTPNFRARNVFLKNVQNSFNVKDSYGESLFPEGSWRKDMHVSEENLACNFEIGLVYNSESGKIMWMKHPLFNIFGSPKNQVRPDFVSSNLLFGEAIYKGFGIYLPLVSITIDDEESVGDFSTLVALSKWCKQCGIDFLNIHIEQMNGGLIDPIHLSEPVTYEMNLVEMRNAKLANFFQDYKIKKKNGWNQNNDTEFQLFVKLNPRIVQKCKENCGHMNINHENDNLAYEFVLYTQYVLFKELATAFAEILDIGVQLIIDVIASDELAQDIVQFSRYCQGIKIVGLAKYCDFLSVKDINETFGNLSEFVLKAFCKTTNNIVQLLQSAYTPDFITSLQNYYSSDPEFLSKLDKIKSKYETCERNKIVTSCINKIAQDCPATLLVDAHATKLLGGNQSIQSISMVPCQSSPKKVPDNVFDTDIIDQIKNVTLVPNYLSPEKISEFSESIGPSIVSEEIENRAKSKQRCVIVYFYDFLRAMGYTIQTRPIQLIEKHCRCKFSTSVASLMVNQELNNKIQNFLFNWKRSM
ncbi:hypothetical protein TRFO_35615 [Tritrichomonas foetus]|uniref:Uncharacterized protein n=1 Tax=Tritrichomonas foetus TaxID=1144522 RepID=A0A1J4JFZ6_9EUKA|nr:hypothetical protein TRFO_35615 [Tritrichomonas foetus]|eukprot:OHS98048.1 hypothetical protein TRFO_35615 [Tritrichomonas foetus]